MLTICASLVLVKLAADVERVGAAAAIEQFVVLGAHDRIGARIANDVVVTRAARHRRAASRLIDDDQVPARSGIQCERAVALLVKVTVPALLVADPSVAVTVKAPLSV